MKVILVGLDCFKAKNGNLYVTLGCIGAKENHVENPDGTFSIGHRVGRDAIFLPAELFSYLPRLKSSCGSEIDLIYEKDLGDVRERLVDIDFLDGELKE